MLISIAFAVSFLLFFCPIKNAKAATLIKEDFIEEDTTWGLQGSPYILLSDVKVIGGVTLTIEAGVEVTIDPIYEYESYVPGIGVERGSLVIGAKGGDRVHIHNINKIYANSGNVEIYNTDFSDMGLRFNDSIVRMASSTYQKNFDPIYIIGGNVKIWGSVISDNDYGLHIQGFEDIGFPAKNQFLPDTGGVGNAFSENHNFSVDINGSSITGNKFYAIWNPSTSTVNVTHNWWGSSDGPNVSSLEGNNNLSGLFDYSSWLHSAPVLDGGVGTTTIECCSSVLFLPGLEGSRLFRNPIASVYRVDKLWEPNWSQDVKQLFLDENGKSINKDIYSGSPIDKALGVVDVYSKFMKSMDSLVKDSVINDWKSFGYDWRKPINEVVAGAENRGTITESLVKTLENLADRSRTGKVTLIAHSNGGLVAKYLVKTLVDMGKSNLIDKVISVAVPYLGTPQSIASILYGDGQSIGGGIVVGQSTMKDLGINMPSAYSLLPSAEYFNKIFMPTIAYASSSVDSSAEQSEFLINKNINKSLLMAANVLHLALDKFAWPAHIARWAIVGWNKDTLSGLVYKNISAFSKKESNMGDDTVLAPSAAYEAGTVASGDIRDISKQEKKYIAHFNILEASSTQKVVKDMIAKNPSDKPFDLPQGFGWGEPDYSKETTSIVISTHSPVEMHIYDEEGNHTGKIPTPATDEPVEEGFLYFFEESISGSSFDIIQTDDPNDYQTTIRLPDEGKKYTVKIKGLATGTFDYEIAREKVMETYGTAMYSKIPVTVNTTANMVIQFAPPAPGSTTTPGFASSSPTLSVDFDGDGKVDAKVLPNKEHIEKMDAVLLIKALKSMIAGFIGTTTPRAKVTMLFFDLLEKRANRIKTDHMVKLMERLAKFIENKPVRQLTQAEKNQALAMIDAFVEQNK